MAYNFLVVDDSSLMRSMVRRIIEVAGLPAEKVLLARDGSEGLEVMRQNRIDLVITDINMPVMNGIDMIAAMRDDEVLENMPVIVMSTEGSTTCREKLDALGVLSIIHKPFQPGEFADTVGGCIPGIHS